jgi:diguanylate cyclase (GGDEF)-like protein
VARRGGDEFAMLVPDAGGRADVERIAARLLHAVEQPVMLAPGVQRQLSASVGIALSPDQGRDLEQLLQLADRAMYTAKEHGKNRFAFAEGSAGASAVAPVMALTPSVPRAARAS